MKADRYPATGEMTELPYIFNNKPLFLLFTMESRLYLLWAAVLYGILRYAIFLELDMFFKTKKEKEEARVRNKHKAAILFSMFMK